MKPKVTKKKIHIHWSCGVKHFCEHKTKLGAWLHIKLRELTEF